MLTALKRFLAGTIQPNTLARLTLAVDILLVILVAHSFAQFSWRLLPLTSRTLPSSEEPLGNPSPVPLGESKRADYTAIADWHLFGRVNEPKSAMPLSELQAPETKLNLKLVGIYFTHEDKKALAIIGEGTGEELTYSIGDQLPQSKARLEQILRDRVVLSRHGRLETLSLPIETDGNEITPLVNAQPPPIESGNDAPIEGDNDAPTNPEEAETVPDEQTSNVITTPESIDASPIATHFRHKITTHPQGLQDLALATPYVQNGQFRGFRLRPGRDRELLARLGLRAGDVITVVNGTRLNDPSQGLGVLQQLVSANQVNVQVLRNGAEIPLTFILNSQ
jgi:general secretion pathway protein C